MNILVDKIENIVNSHITTKINQDFRTCILFELLMQDRSIDEKAKLVQTIRLFCGEEIPDDIEKAINDILWFYAGGIEKIANKTPSKSGETQKQIYSFEHDDKLIYSAFLSQYGIDLQDIPYLHWWKFKAMFEGLNQDNKIVEVMSYRAINTLKIKDKEEKARIKKIQKAYALPDMRTEEEKERDFNSAFAF